MVVLNQKIALNLRDFVLRGKFDCLELGMSRDQVLKVLPQPELTNKESLCNSTIWRYGEFELYFDEESGGLRQIFSDYIPSLDGGDVFDVSRWMLGEELELSCFLAALNQAEVDYQVTHSQNLDASIVKISKSAVDVAFSVRDDGNGAGKRYCSALWKG